MIARRAEKCWWNVIAISLISLTVCLLAAYSAPKKLSQDRIDEVAGMLSEEPKGFGRPIEDRAAWNRLKADSSFDGAIGRAERLQKKPLPEQPDELYLDFSRTGNRRRWQRVAGRRRGRIETFVLAECMENKGRFIAPLEETIRALCAEPTWVMPAHDRSLRNFRGEQIDIDLGSSALGWELALTDYILGDKLNSEVRDLLRKKVRERILDPFLKMVRGEREPNWWLHTTNNWNSVCLAGVTGAALTQVESRQERAEFVVAAEEYSKNLLRGFTSGGYCTEGVGYWNYGFGHYVQLAEGIYQATDGGVDLLARERVRPTATYGAKIKIINDVCPAFADCSVGSRPSPDILYFVSRRLGLGLREYERRDVVSPSGDLSETLMYSFPNSASLAQLSEEPSAGPGPRTWFDEAGVLIGRSGEHEACRMGVALKGGHNAEHHNHNDVGSYVAVVGSQPVLLDPGPEVYTARTFSSKRYQSDVLNSYGHPVPVVSGKLQRKGRKARGKVLRKEFGEHSDTLVLDISSAYAVPELKKLQRTFAYSRKGKGSLTVTDEVAFEEPKEFGTALVTLGRWKKLGPSRLKVYDTHSAVKVEIKTHGGEVEIDSERIEEDVRTRSLPTRIGIDFKKPVKEARITVEIEPLEEEISGLRNGGFEEGSWAWRLGDGGLSSICADRAAVGKQCLEIMDESSDRGSDAKSIRIPAEQNREFEVSGKVLRLSGREKGVGIYVRFYDEEGEMLNEQKGKQGHISPLLRVGESSNNWQEFSTRFTAPDGTEELLLWIHSFNAIQTRTLLDDLQIKSVE